MPCFLCSKAALTPYLPKKQNSSMPFSAVFFMILFYGFFKDIYLDSFIRPLFPYASAAQGTVFTYRFRTPVFFRHCICSSVKPVQGKLFFPGADKGIFLYIILEVFSLNKISHVPHLQKPCVCCRRSAPLLLTLCCSCANLLLLFVCIYKKDSILCFG